MVPTKSKFYFKSKKEKDDNGNVVMVKEVKEVKNKEGVVVEVRETGKMIEKIIPAPEPIEVEIPLLTLEDVVAILNGGDEKEIKLILEACNNIILEQARDQVNDPDANVRENGLNTEALSWKTIAYLPPATRKGSAIPDETWEAFEKDYVSVMVHHGKTEEKAKMGAKLLVKRYQPVKTNKKVIKALKENLSTWFANSEKAEDFADVYETLAQKADTLLEADEDAILAAV
jgi:hypothetical protein